MAGLGSPHGLPAEPKQISSRLLNMKFMQRAAASDRSKPSSTPSTPSGEHAPKRRRTGEHFPSNHDSTATTPTTTTTPTYKDRFAEPISFSPGLDPPSHNIKSYAGEHYETEWVLDQHLPTTNSHQSQDSDSNTSDTDIWSTSNPPGVQTYGAFKKNPKSGPKSPSISKSARRNATEKRTADDADLSSLPSDSENEDPNSSSSSSSDENPSSENKYSHSRLDAARYKTNHKSQTTILGRDHNQLLQGIDRDTQSDYMKLDSEHGISSRGGSHPHSQSKKGRDKKSYPSSNSKRGRISIGGGEGNGGNRNNNNNNNSGGGGGSNRKKKRKTM